MNTDNETLADAIIHTLANVFVEFLQRPLINGSIWIYPDEHDKSNRTICALAYAAASIGKVTIELRGGHSVVRLVT